MPKWKKYHVPTEKKRLKHLVFIFSQKCFSDAKTHFYKLKMLEYTWKKWLFKNDSTITITIPEFPLDSDNSERPLWPAKFEFTGQMYNAPAITVTHVKPLLFPDLWENEQVIFSTSSTVPYLSHLNCWSHSFLNDRLVFRFLAGTASASSFSVWMTSTCTSGSGLWFSSSRSSLGTGFL